MMQSLTACITWCRTVSPHTDLVLCGDCQLLARRQRQRIAPLLLLLQQWLLLLPAVLPAHCLPACRACAVTGVSVACTPADWLAIHSLPTVLSTASFSFLFLIACGRCCHRTVCLLLLSCGCS